MEEYVKKGGCYSVLTNESVIAILGDEGGTSIT